MTIREAKNIARTFQCTLNRNSQFGEFRVKHQITKETYFTDDLKDAVDTAKAMNDRLSK